MFRRIKNFRYSVVFLVRFIFYSDRFWNGEIEKAKIFQETVLWLNDRLKNVIMEIGKEFDMKFW